MSAFLGEIIGTAVLIMFGGGVVAGVSLYKTKSNGGGWVVVTLAWGLAVTMGVYASGQYSGGHINPAVTFAFAMTGDFPWSEVPMYILGQMIGAIIGATIVFLHYLPHFKATKDQATKLGVFSTAPAIKHTPSNLLSELIGTFILIFGLMFIGTNEFSDGLNPIVVGLLIVVIGMAFGGTTGYAINPARDLGPRIAHFILPIPGKGSSDWGYSWIPVIGPLLGGALGGLTYKALFLGEVTVSLWITLALTLIVIFFSYSTITQVAEEKDSITM
ncbi:MIP/aquaporin family protein [Fervidibacillus halotolerans]|uniref:Aquaporin family protein n=1 Tax=Fervidibacillus halotolerans TaxID=2980027 RepID=A0A9E8S1D3_9BACI|nr:MIP/aquaporin family protein [Fervidibacillus halotolerans]WAA13412.1 aquaporin family protein [Fervidibacillus halotolerans]